MRVLITGSRGFIGQHLVLRLLEREHEVVDIGSVTEPEKLLPAAWRQGPFTLVDLAWNLDRAFAFGPQAQQIQRTAELLDRLTPLGLSAVVVAGSAVEYGRREGVLQEDVPPLEPLSPYGWGKQAARTLLAAWHARTKVPTCWLRPFQVYGPGQAERMVVPYVLACLRGNEVARLTSGTQVRDFVHVSDVADAFVLAVERPLTGFHVLNVGTGQGTPVREVLGWLGECLEAAHLLRFGAIAPRPDETRSQIADPTRVRQSLGWQPRISWRQGIEQLARPSEEAPRWVG